MTTKDDRPIRIGVMALQGSFAEHLKQIDGIQGAVGVPVKTRAQLDQVDAMILPGGESTAMRKLMAPDRFDLELKKRIMGGMPVWGTCAGMILLAETVVGEASHLGVMGFTVCRNAYGTQADSFTALGSWVMDGEARAEMVHIRAPRVETYRNPAVPAAMMNGEVTGIVQGHMLATAFHPEISGDQTPYLWLMDQVKINLY